MGIAVRRVITGQTPEGKSVFSHVEEVEPLQLGATSWYGVWGWDDIPTLPFHMPDAYDARSVFPGANPGALRVNTVVFPPGAGTPDAPPRGEPSAEYQQLLAAVPAGGFHGEGGMHCTDSIEVALVVDGEIGLEQDDGVEVTLRKGDVLVQNGAVHAWRNRTDKPCMVCFIVIGASRDAAPEEAAS